MKVQKRTSLTEQAWQLDSLVIIKITGDVIDIINFINTQLIDHILLIGDKDMISRVISQINYLFSNNWVETYCIISRNNTYYRYIPIPEARIQPDSSLELQIRNFRILYIPTTLNTLNFQQKSSFNIILSPSINPLYTLLTNWEYYENPYSDSGGLYSFLPQGSEWNELVRHIGTHICILFIPNLQLELLERCFFIDTEYSSEQPYI